MNLATHEEVFLASNSIEDKQGERVTGFLAVWHRPEITLIDVRRTMFFGGAYFDGPTGSTSPI